MTFKQVAGLTGRRYAEKAIDVAISNGYGPEYVDRWIKWLDTTPAVETPKAEYFIGDLEEVAHAVLSEVETAMLHLAQAMYDSQIPPEIKGVLSGLAQRMATPGYVEGLLPCE